MIKSFTSDDETGGTDVSSLDVSEYFFESARVAKAYPNLLESAIVLAYHSYHPGRFAQKWHRHKRQSSNLSNSCLSFCSILSNFTLFSTFLTFMLLVGTYPLRGQKFGIHFLQPVILTLGAFFINVASNHPLYFIIPAVFIVLEIIQIYRLRRRPDAPISPHASILQEEEDPIAKKIQRLRSEDHEDVVVHDEVIAIGGGSPVVERESWVIEDVSHHGQPVNEEKKDDRAGEPRIASQPSFENEMEDGSILTLE